MMLNFIYEATESTDEYTTGSVMDGQCNIRHVYSYLPSCTALPLLSGWLLFSILLTVRG